MLWPCGRRCSDPRFGMLLRGDARGSAPARTGATRCLETREASALTLVFAALYLSTLAVNHTEAEDALSYAVQVQSGRLDELFHSNHLLFNAAGRVVLRALEAAGYRGPATLAMQLLNVAAGCGTLFLLARMTRRLRVPRSLALLGVSATGLSYGFWWYSVEADTYILPLPFMVLALDRLMTAVERPGRASDPALMALYASLATLFHQQQVLVGIVLFAVSWIVAPPGAARLRAAALFAGTAVTVVGGAYVYVGFAIQECANLEQFVDWARGLARPQRWGGLSLGSIPKAALGFSRAISGLHFVLGFEPVFEAVSRALPGKLMLEERFLGASLHPALRWSCVLLTGVMLLAFARFVAPLFGGRSARAAREPAWVFLRACLAVTIANVLGAWLWEPANTEFWIVVLPLGWLLTTVALAARGVGRGTLAAGVVFVATLGASNLWGSVLPQTSHAGDFWYRADEYLIRNARPGDLIVTRGGYISENYLRLYTPAEVVTVRDPERVREAVAGHRGRVLVSSWVKAPLPEVARSGSAASRDEAALKRLVEELERGFRELHRDRFQTVYEYVRPPSS